MMVVVYLFPLLSFISDGRKGVHSAAYDATYSTSMCYLIPSGG